MSFLRKRGSGGLNKKKQNKKKQTNKKKRKEGFLTALATAIKKDPITSMRWHGNQLKDYEKTVRTAIKQDLSPDLNPLDYAIWVVLENRTKATFYPSIDSLKTAIEKEWNKISEEFILKKCK